MVPALWLLSGNLVNTRSNTDGGLPIRNRAGWAIDWHRHSPPAVGRRFLSSPSDQGHLRFDQSTAVKLLREISASSRGGVSHVSVKAMIYVWFEDISEQNSNSWNGDRHKNVYGKDLRVCEVSASVTYLVPVFRPLSECHLAKEVHVCMHLIIGKGQIVHKGAYWDENGLKSKSQGLI